MRIGWLIQWLPPPPLSPAISQTCKATDIYGLPIKYKTVDWILQERLKLNKGCYLEPFYNLVGKKTCKQKTVENLYKNKVHEKSMQQWTLTWRTDRRLWSKGSIVSEPLFFGKVAVGMWRQGASNLVPAGGVGKLLTSHCVPTGQARDPDDAQTNHRLSERRRTRLSIAGPSLQPSPFRNLKCSWVRAFEPRVLVCNSSQYNLIW